MNFLVLYNEDISIKVAWRFFEVYMKKLCELGWLHIREDIKDRVKKSLTEN